MTGCASDKVLSLLPAALLGLQRPQNGMMWNDCVFFRMVNYEASKSQWNYFWQEISEAIQPWQLMHHSQHWLEMVWMCSHPSPRPPSEAQIHLAVLEPDHPGSQCSDGQSVQWWTPRTTQKITKIWFQLIHIDSLKNGHAWHPTWHHQTQPPLPSRTMLTW